MDTYNVLIFPPAQKDLDKISGKLLDRLETAIINLSMEPRPASSKKLKGKDRIFRLRVGDYRVLYGVDDSKKRVNIYRVLHRKDAYR